MSAATDLTGKSDLRYVGAWRVIRHDEGGALWNMAVDEAVFEAVAAGLAPPTLRFYRWDSAAISVGRFQDASRGIDLEECGRLGILVVRRLTGGRGVLHGGDQTFSLSFPAAELGAAGARVVESYRLIAQGIAGGLRELGAAALPGECERRAGRGGDCFAVRSRADLLSPDGAKLVGSAQYRRAGMLLQQSSLRHRPAAVRPDRLFLGPVGPHSFPLELKADSEVTSALESGLAAALGVRFRTGSLNEWEMERAGALISSGEGLHRVDSRTGLCYTSPGS